jgi:hypothetical protein
MQFMEIFPVYIQNIKRSVKYKTQSYWLLHQMVYSITTEF